MIHEIRQTREHSPVIQKNSTSKDFSSARDCRQFTNIPFNRIWSVYHATSFPGKPLPSFSACVLIILYLESMPAGPILTFIQPFHFNKHISVLGGWDTPLKSTMTHLGNKGSVTSIEILSISWDNARKIQYLLCLPFYNIHWIYNPSNKTLEELIIRIII